MSVMVAQHGLSNKIGAVGSGFNGAVRSANYCLVQGNMDDNEPNGESCVKPEIYASSLQPVVLAVKDQVLY